MNVRSGSPRAAARDAGRRLIAAIAVIAAFSSCNDLTPPNQPAAPKGASRAVNASGVPFTVEFYLQAHQDDWQLFYGDRPAAAVLTAAKVVFVYTTAGDGGSGTTFPAYWQAREQAVNASVDTITIATPGPWACANSTVNTHVIYRCTRANTVSYYLHLPNLGDNSARGMSALRDGLISTLTAVDGTSTYTSWGDLVSTLQSIIATEAGTEPDVNVAIHAPEIDRTVNEYDHVDHLATGDATHAAIAAHDYNRFWYIDYQNQYYPANLTPAQLAAKWGTVYAYDHVMKALMGETLLNSGSDTYVWVPRTIYRSEPSSGTPPPPPPTGPPNAPSALAASTATGTSIDLTWTDNSSDEDGFKIERAPDAGGVAGTYAEIGSVGANVHNYSDAASVATNVRYWYRVVAYNSYGSSSYSNETSAMLAPPAAPSALQSTPNSAARIDLSWTDNSANELGFRVERAPDAGGVAGTYAQIGTVGVNVNTYSDAAVQVNVRYWYRVVAYNSIGSSNYSNESSAILATPNAPSGLQGTAISGTRIDLSWTDNSADESGFRIERAPDVGGVAGTYAQIASVGANVVTYSNTGLVASTTYWYRVRAYNTLGTSAYSTEVGVATMSAPKPPSALVATAASGTRINLSWTDNSTDESGFRIERAPDAGGAPGAFAQIASVGTNVTTYGNTGLPNGTRYWYRVRAYNSVGTSAYSNVADATTLRLPAAPTNLQAALSIPRAVDVTWTDNADNETSYRLERAPDVGGAPGSFALVTTLGANATSYQNTGLASSTTYWFRVRAQNSVGNSAWAPAVQVTTLPPVSPSNLAVRAYLIGTQRNADLTWTPGSEAKIDVWRAGTKIKSSVNNTGGPLNNTSSASLGLSVGYQVCLVGLTDAASCTLVVYANY